MMDRDSFVRLNSKFMLNDIEIMDYDEFLDIWSFNKTINSTVKSRVFNKYEKKDNWKERLRKCIYLTNIKLSNAELSKLSGISKQSIYNYKLGYMYGSDEIFYTITNKLSLNYEENKNMYNKELLIKVKELIEKSFNKEVNLEVLMLLIENGNISLKIAETKKALVSNLIGLADAWKYYEYDNIMNKLFDIKTDNPYDNIMDIIINDYIKTNGGFIYNNDELYAYLVDNTNCIYQIFNKIIATDRYTFICNNSPAIMSDLNSKISYETFKDKWCTVNDIKIFDKYIPSKDSNKDWTKYIKNSMILTKLNLSIRQMSLKSGLSYPTVKRAVEGCIFVSDDTIDKLQKGLGVKLYK